MAIFTDDLGIAVGDAAKKTNFDNLLDNTLCNGYRLKVLKTISASPASVWMISTLTYVPIGPNLTVGDFWENGSRLVGANYLRWEISYNSVSGGGGYIHLYNLTDAAAVAGSEVNCPAITAYASVQLPASSANYFSLVSTTEKKYQIQFKAQNSGKAFYVDMVRLVAVMPIV